MKFHLSIWDFFMILIFLWSYSQVKATKFSTSSICLGETWSSSDVTSKNLVCEEKNEGLFITEVEYKNDHMGICSSVKSENALNEQQTSNLAVIRYQSNKNVGSFRTNVEKCAAYPTQLLADICNGKNECSISLKAPSFNYSFWGSNCYFKAEILRITYECIPVNFNDESIPKYDVCSDKHSIDHPMHGFIHSPNYPNIYESGKYCQLTIKVDGTIERLEIFLIHLELESLSKRTANPTDYLQINNKEKYFGEKNFLRLYNESNDAVIVFKSDIWFNKKGFFLYFNAKSKQTPIDLIEELDMDEELKEEITTTKTHTSTTLSPNSTTIELQSNFTSVDFYEMKASVSLFNQTNKINVNDLIPAASKKERPILRNDSDDLSNDFFSKHTTKAMLTLMVLIVILSSIIIFLVLKNSESTLYKTAIPIGHLSRYNDTTFANGYLDTTSLANGFTDRNSIINLNGHFNMDVHNEFSSAATAKVSNKFISKRISDDSMAHLLLSSANNSPASNCVDILNSNNAGILLSKKKLQFPNQNCEVYEDINLHSIKGNEYYAPTANIMLGDGCSLPRSSRSSSSNDAQLIETQPSTSSKSTSQFNSPVVDRKNQNSIPCLPKTLPPEKDDKINNQNINNDYDVPDVSKIIAPNEYTTYLVRESCEVNSEQEECLDYQVPINLPKKDSNE